MSIVEAICQPLEAEGPVLVPLITDRQPLTYIGGSGTCIDDLLHTSRVEAFSVPKKPSALSA